jgi:lipopolysaccharide transport system permease protein
VIRGSSTRPTTLLAVAEPVAEIRPVGKEPFPEEEDTTLEEEDEAAQAGPATPALWRAPLLEGAREAWHGRHLIRALSLRGLPTFEGYLLGRGWLFLRPGLPLLLYGIFGRAVGVKAPGGIPYLLFLVFSMQGWLTFQMTLISQCVGVRMFRKLTRTLKLPVLLITFAGPALGLVYLAVYWLFAIALLLYYGLTKGHLYLAPPQQVLAGLAGLVLALAWGWAMGTPFSLLYMKARDVRYALRYLTRLWMFVTPVIYPIETLHGTARTLAQFNPLTGVMSLVQYGFLGAGTPNRYAVAWSVGGLLLLVAAGFWLFNRYGLQLIARDAASKEDEEDEEDEAA